MPTNCRAALEAPRDVHVRMVARRLVFSVIREHGSTGTDRGLLDAVIQSAFTDIRQQLMIA